MQCDRAGKLALFFVPFRGIFLPICRVDFVPAMCYNKSVEKLDRWFHGLNLPVILETYILRNDSRTTRYARTAALHGFGAGLPKPVCIGTQTGMAGCRCEIHSRRIFFMPKNKVQEVIFTILMVFRDGLRHDLLQHCRRDRRHDESGLSPCVPGTADYGTHRIFCWTFSWWAVWRRRRRSASSTRKRTTPFTWFWRFQRLVGAV